jgi:hypothetical protein
LLKGNSPPADAAGERESPTISAAFREGKPSKLCAAFFCG